MSIKLEFYRLILDKFSIKCNEISPSGSQVVPRERMDRHDQAIRLNVFHPEVVSKVK
jgi:hypothetical protein